MKGILTVAVLLASGLAVARGDEPPAAAKSGHALTVRGTRFLLNGEPFPYTGMSFFNAIYNPAFNKSSTDRRAWLEKFKRYGVNVLRVWGQWDNKRGFADAGPDATLYHADGTLRDAHLKTLKAILADADAEGMVVLLCLFAQESRKDGILLKPEAADRAVAALARELKPFRNFAFQVWNEHSERTVELLKVIKAQDPDRLVTSSPGVSGVMGSDEENRALDFLTPHTSRYGKGRPWELGPPEIEGLLKKFNKPVVDDEPARTGTPKFGGPKDGSAPTDHILQIARVWQIGGHATYHHDMFQTGYNTPAVPPSGVPDPEFSPYHQQVFEFLKLRDRYLPAGPAFPLRASENGRYLVDRTGTPFLVHADTGWRAIMALTVDEAKRYFDDRKAKGFTAVHLHAINKEKTGPATRAGHHPFDPQDDLAKPSEAYWKHADAVLQAAADRGLLVVLSSSWFGYNGSGWRKQLTPESARAYGTFLGKRYKRFDNILWVHAGDNDPGDKADAVAALAKAIEAEAPHHLHTAHVHPENASAVHFADADWLDVNMAYTYKEADLQVAAEHARKGKVRPVYLGETGYEGESNTKFLWTPTLVRRQPYRALLSGACGHAVGSATVWHFGPGWEKALDMEATRQMVHVKALFTALPWWRLIPDAKGELISDGRGTPGQPDFVPAARTDDGTFAVVYLPTPAAFTVDLSKLAGQRFKAWWFNPRDGKATAVDATVSGGRHQFSPPTVGMEDDWVLVLHAADKSFAPPGLPSSPRP